MNFLQRLIELIQNLVGGNGTPPAQEMPAPVAEPLIQVQDAAEADDQDGRAQRPAVEAPPGTVTETIPTETTTQPPAPSMPIAPEIEQPLPGEVDTGTTPAVLHRRVKMIVFDPRLGDGRSLVQDLRFNDPAQLAQELISDLKLVSGGCMDFEITETVTVDGLPRKKDGFTYTAAAFVDAFRSRMGFHEPDAVDYTRLIAEQNILQGIQEDKFDEVWLFAPPFSGFNESVMGGSGAFYCNGSALAGTDSVSKRFIVMGFNYERGVGEMLESMGHRAEFTMLQVYRRRMGSANLWQRFIQIDMTNPGNAEVGSVHFAPNSLRDYEWGNSRTVPSRCDHWSNFPNIDGNPRIVDCTEWGGGDIRLHHLWWFKHFPRKTGQVGGISANWWRYVANPNFVR